MGPVVPTLRGIFQPVRRGSAFDTALTDRPFVELNVSYRSAQSERDHNILFLVDTGADGTVLEPTDAYALLGDEFFGIDFDRDPYMRYSVGIGGYARRVVRVAVLSAIAIEGDYIGMVQNISIAEPTPRVPTREESGNWSAPSLLGRDVLRYFEIHLDYYPSNRLELWFDRNAYQVISEYEDRQRDAERYR